MNRPKFKKAWDASMDIYDPNNTAAHVAEIIGGKVAQNINDTNGWENTCTVRMSYILNNSGCPIPFIKDKTVSGKSVDDWYLFRVRDLTDYLKNIFGNPDSTIIDPTPTCEGLVDCHGILIFQVKGFSNASGHATLWNGLTCYDHCYFDDESKSYDTENALFWKLP